MTRLDFAQHSRKDLADDGSSKQHDVPPRAWRAVQLRAMLYSSCRDIAPSVYHNEQEYTIIQKYEPGHLSILGLLVYSLDAAIHAENGTEPPSPPHPTPTPLTINILRLYKEFIRERDIMKPALRLKGTILRIYWLLILFQ